MKIKSCLLPKPLVKKEKFNFEYGHFIRTAVSHESKVGEIENEAGQLLSLETNFVTRVVGERHGRPTSVMKASPICLNL
jgi:hypothetical protein